MDNKSTHEMLRSLYIPAADDAAVSRIVQLAKENPRRQFPLFAPLRLLKAWLYVPSMRYVVMASVVGLFILIGAVGNPPTAPEATTIAQQEAAPSNQQDMPETMLLYDVEFAEEEWAENFFADASGY
ncbi:MAG: hypothetical protein MRY32_03385 [Rickettsiales bacterium]|nr:hypothetical protein [Rickettsiales bacterium]